ncbi:MAG: DUF2489 domain-containing protein [Alteromonadaceae bacterium]|nr:DUF2489 domain-containing protein [Alteromonadaceae bacterium]
MLNVWLIAILVGIIIISSLAFYAGKLLMQLKQQKQAQQQTEQAHQSALKMHDKKVLDSVVIIARAMKEEQCDVSEGCWRLSVLLNSLKTSKQLEQEFPAIFGLYGKIKHLSIAGKRKELVKKQRMQQDLERIKLEAEYSSQVRKDIDLLHQYAVERISVLTS